MPSKPQTIPLDEQLLLVSTLNVPHIRVSLANYRLGVVYQQDDELLNTPCYFTFTKAALVHYLHTPPEICQRHLQQSPAETSHDAPILKAAEEDLSPAGYTMGSLKAGRNLSPWKRRRRSISWRLWVYEGVGATQEHAAVPIQRQRPFMIAPERGTVAKGSDNRR